MAQPTSSALRALALEYKSLQEEPVEGFRVKLVNEDNMFEWEVAIFGPPDTLYQGGYFKVPRPFLFPPCVYVMCAACVACAPIFTRVAMRRHTTHATYRRCAHDAHRRSLVRSPRCVASCFSPSERERERERDRSLARSPSGRCVHTARADPLYRALRDIAAGERKQKRP